jgi:hyperosmotically inducible protein
MRDAWKGLIMQRLMRSTAAMLGTIVMLVAASGVARADAKSTVEEIRKELMQLPYYGVFDYLAFKYDKGTVTLMGYAYAPGLKRDAERAVKRVAGVDQVVDKIEDLPASQMDDELRWKTYYAIYRDPFLSRYAPGGGMLWGHRHGLGPEFHPFSGGPFPGMEPAGDYPIHIIVKNGRITLIGVVDSESDKTLAGMKAREVPGSFGVDNQLIVEREEKSTKR